MPDVETYIIYTGRSIPRILSSGRLETDSEGRQILSLNKEFFGGEAGKPELTAKVYPEVFRICEEEGILTEYLSKHKAEVEKIMMTMVSPEYVQKASQRTAMIRASIKALRKLGQTDSQVMNYLVEEYGITLEYAQNCLDAEWVEDTIFA